MSDIHGDLTRAARIIGEWFTAVYEDLNAMSDACERELRSALGTKAVLTEKHLRAIRPAAATFLDRHTIPEAAGIVLGPGVVSAANGAIEWWRRGTAGATNRVVFALSPGSAGFYDFVTYDWFTEVVTNQVPAIQGPYLDYAGLDQYILTSTVPLTLGGVLIGTAGCDTDVSALESVMVPILRKIPADAALVSKFDRIVVGNSGRFLVGNRVGNLPEDSIRTGVPGVDLGLQLVAAPHTHTF